MFPELDPKDEFVMCKVPTLFGPVKDVYDVFCSKQKFVEVVEFAVS
jgi:hypothetical protein